MPQVQPQKNKKLKGGGNESPQKELSQAVCSPILVCVHILKGITHIKGQKLKEFLLWL